MAIDTSIDLRNLQFYQVFIRQFSSTHDFKGVIKQLRRIKDLGTDVIQLVPFHPIGIFRRKGAIGSPYSIKDYYQIDPMHGDFNDFKQFIDFAHAYGMKVIMDIVFNHTSHDANYTKTHPHWYYQKPDGTFTNRVGDWWDIADLKIDNNIDLQEELINVLTYWVNLGIDGFRCDVAPLIPKSFWKKARQTLSKINPHLLWVSESVHRSFIKYLRDLGYEALSDGEVYQIFDILYDYDIFDHFENYFTKNAPLKEWVDNLLDQETIYPANFVKLRYLENHDLARGANYAKTIAQLRTLNALLFFLKGSVFIYNGQEIGIKHRPDLFEIDTIDWTHQDIASITPLISYLSDFKKDANYINDPLTIEMLNAHVLLFKYQRTDQSQEVYGIFNLSSIPQEVNLKIKGYDILTNDLIKPGLKLITEPIIIINR